MHSQSELMPMRLRELLVVMLLSATLFVLGRVVANRWQSQDQAKNPEQCEADGATLEQVLASSRGESWPAKRQELIRSGRLKVEQMDSPIAMGQLEPWAMTRVKVEAIVLGGVRSRQPRV